MPETTCNARSKKVLNKQTNKLTLMSICQKGIRTQLKELPMAKAGTFEQLNK